MLPGMQFIALDLLYSLSSLCTCSVHLGLSTDYLCYWLSTLAHWRLIILWILSVCHIWTFGSLWIKQLQRYNKESVGRQEKKRKVCIKMKRNNEAKLKECNKPPFYHVVTAYLMGACECYTCIVDELYICIFFLMPLWFSLIDSVLLI